MMISDTELLALRNKLHATEWAKEIKLLKRKKRHEGIDFTNPRHEALKEQVKQEIEKRGLNNV